MRWKRNWLQLELLEDRRLLSADFDSNATDLSQANVDSIPAFTWFASNDRAPRIQLAELEKFDPILPTDAFGPVRPAVGEWIVQLTDEASREIRRTSDIQTLLESNGGGFSFINGLGSEGLVLVRGEGADRENIETLLTSHPSVESFDLNSLISGQATTPNDSDYVAGLLPGLNRIGAPAAWDTTRGSISTVVGVVDTGIDPTHPDLYLNIWLNQGELPPKFLDNVGPKLTDIDGDGLISFYDLNNVMRAAAAPYSLSFGGFRNGPNAPFVRDLNSNGYIDAKDLLADANWANGLDEDLNGFFDDFYGVNFRAGEGDPFEPNNPSDELGHGTHVSGTIGAIGGNGSGVVGVNWQTSLMALRILDNNNQGDSGAAIRAINYAREMRERVTKDDSGRITQGANVRVLNNSWGQPGGFEVSLEAAIIDSYDAGILFVAAAGNGNILGQGVNNDQTPFYPASYDVPSVIAVAAMDLANQPATFSNFGPESVDLFAPGVGIRSTLPGGAYGNANGTSMATPHVAGSAALIWAALPEATVDEVRQAILDSASATPFGADLVSSRGRLNANGAISSNVFAPSARLVSKQSITANGGTSTEFTVEYYHRNGILRSSIGNNDVIVKRQWGPQNQFPVAVKPGSISSTATTTTVTYVMTAPGGTWNPGDYGDYVISTVEGKVSSTTGDRQTEARVIGSFNVKIDSPSVLYVDTFADTGGTGSLRSAIIAANAAAPAPRTIILNAGSYSIDIPPVVDPGVSYPIPTSRAGGLVAGNDQFDWSNETTGDFVITGNVTILGDQKERTFISSNVLDRVFRVFDGGVLKLNRVTITGGTAPHSQPGGGILSAGQLTIDLSNVTGNRTSVTENLPADGGGIAVVDGTATITRSVISENAARASAGVLFVGDATGTIDQSTIDSNVAANSANVETFGGAVGSYSINDVGITNTTISRNTGVAIHAGVVQGPDNTGDRFNLPTELSTSRDGRYSVFSSSVGNLTSDDTNQLSDIFLYDRVTDDLQRITNSSTGPSFSPRISADGSTIVFASDANDLVPNDTNSRTDVFAINRITRTIRRVSETANGRQLTEPSTSPDVNANGQFVVFETGSTGVLPNDSNNSLSGNTGNDPTIDVYRKNLNTNGIALVSRDSDGAIYDPNATFSSGLRIGYDASISDDGTRVAFASDYYDLDRTNPTLTSSSVYVRDIAASTTTLASNSVFIFERNESPAISGDGNSVVFSSTAQGFVNGSQSDFNGATDIFLYRVNDQTVQLVSTKSDGGQLSANSSSPDINFDGTVVTFLAPASSLIPNAPPSGSNDVFVKSLTNGNLRHVTGNASAGALDDDSFAPQVSGDGSVIAFYSLANNLTDGSTSLTRDVFLYSVAADAVESITSLPTGKITVINSTVAFNNNIVSAWGNVHSGNSLFVANTSTEAISKLGTSLGGNLYDTASGPSSATDRVVPAAKDFVAPLTQLRNGTLGYPLRRSSTAIDTGVAAIAPPVDQRGSARSTPDIGSIEAVDATVFGTYFVDTNGDGNLDRDEVGIAGVTVFLDLNQNGKLDTNEPVTVSANNDPATEVNETGAFQFENVAPGEYFIASLPLAGFDAVLPLYQEAQLDGALHLVGPSAPSISGDGSITVFDSTTSILVPGGNIDQRDIYVFDRNNTSPTLISAGDTGRQQIIDSVKPTISRDGRLVAYTNDGTVGYTEWATILNGESKPRFLSIATGSDAQISGDGRFVVFTSNSTLVGNDSNNEDDIFVYEIVTGTTRRVSNSSSGAAGLGRSFQATISHDGRFVAFLSAATDLVTGDVNQKTDAFVFDAQTGLLDLVSVNSIGEQGTSDAVFSPKISDDGRYVAFGSLAQNYVPGDVRPFAKAFVFDRTLRTLTRIGTSISSLEPNGPILLPSISGDGKHVVFQSAATNLVPTEPIVASNIFVYDLASKEVARVSGDVFGQPFPDESRVPSISNDGALVGYRRSNNTVIVTRNPLEPVLVETTLQAGDRFNANLPTYAQAGEIRGRLFQDTVANGVYDPGETLLGGWTVFVDLNRDGRLNTNERSLSTVTDSSGQYAFLRLASLREYSIVVDVPPGFETVSPGQESSFAWTIEVQPGAKVTGRDFALKLIESTGQSSSSIVSGRLFDDLNNNNQYDVGVDSPWIGKEVFLDLSNFGVRDSNEPRVLTDSQGRYRIDNLGAQNVAIATTLDETLVHVSPLGSEFTIERYPLYSSVQPFGNPQAIAKGDFNADGFDDVAVALGEGNKLSIRLNDQSGGFLPDVIDVDLGNGGAGPTALVVGQFDGNPLLDVALTANFSSNVVILRNFNPATKSFASRTYVAVGTEPIDIVAGQFGGNSQLDLAVVNKGSSAVANDETVQLLINNGNGVFAARPAVRTGGNSPISIVAGNFTGNAFLDVAVVHALPKTNSTTSGDVTVLRGDGAGGLVTLANAYPVQAFPTDAVVADFNGDGFDDLAVANFSSNSISILLGRANGTFRTQVGSILGTASGALDIAIGDVDNDGDVDIIASNLLDRNISIFRNVGSNPINGEVLFEPLENIGLGQFSVAQRMPLIVGDFDLDTSGPNGAGTLDIVAIPIRTDTLHVLKNQLVDGARRVALTGTNTAAGLDFIIKPAILPPTFDLIATPSPIVEDSVLQSVSIVGIQKGRLSGPALRFSATSSNSSLIVNPTVAYTANSTSAVVRYRPIANASGVSVITVQAIDAGADLAFGTADDGVLERSFTVTVLPVNDAPTLNVPATTSIAQNAGPTTLSGFATGIGPGGGARESSQTLSAFTVSTNTSFFRSVPTLSSTGVLTFEPNPGKSGSVPVTISVTDNGGVANGGVNRTTRTFVLDILPVNNAPTFNLGGNLTVRADAGRQTQLNFASGFAPGGGSDEATQVISDYVVTTTSPNLFSVLPDIANNGTLSFRPAIDRFGTATVSVRVRDNGGRLNGGVDVSSVKTFTITILPTLIVFSIAATAAVHLEGNSGATPFTFTITRSGLTSGISTVNYSVSGVGTNPASASDFQGNVFPKGTVVFAAGVRSMLITVLVLGENRVELGERFNVTLSAPSAPATIDRRVATGSITNDDSSEIDVVGITDGQSAVIDFGTVFVGETGPVQTFRVRNLSNGILTLGNVAVPAGFTVVQALPATLVQNATADLIIRLDTAVAGTKVGPVAIVNNDSNENPFNFRIRGVVAIPPAASSSQISATNLLSQPMSADAIKSLFADTTATMVVESGNRVLVEGEWNFDTAQVVDGWLYRQFTQDDVSLRFTGANSWNNPILAGDVDGNGHTTAGDALLIINGLNLRTLIDDDSVLADPATLSVGEFQFYDVNEDGRLTAGDALSVINILNLQQTTFGSAEHEGSDLLSTNRFAGKSNHPQSIEISEGYVSTGINPAISQRTDGQVGSKSQLPYSGETNKAADDDGSTVNLDATLAETWNWFD